MKNIDVLKLRNKLNDPILKDIKGSKIVYAISKNKKLLKNEAECILETREKVDGFDEYENKRIELCEKYAKKDDKNQPISINNKYLIGNQEAFDNDFRKLKDEYSEILSKVEEKEKKFKEFLDTECDKKFELYKIKQDDLIDDITVEQMDLIEAIFE